MVNVLNCKLIEKNDVPGIYVIFLSNFNQFDNVNVSQFAYQPVNNRVYKIYLL